MYWNRLVEEEDTTVIDKIRSWLREEEIQENKIEDNKNEFHITFWYSKGVNCK